MSKLPYDDRRTRQTKEELLGAGLLATVRPATVPDVIERSWRRCVSIDAPNTRVVVPYRDAVDRHDQMVEAAGPVFERIATHLAGTGVALFLSDSKGQIVLRHVEDRHQRDVYDNASAAEGFDFSENTIGTNGLGTVIEERSPVFVRGCEHFNEALEPLACAGVPIFRPYTRQVVGSFALASKSEAANALMYGMALDIGRQIEIGIASMQGDRERALAQAYLTANQSRREAVLMVSEHSALANEMGLRHLSTESHAVLWQHLLTRGSEVPTRQHVPLPAGAHEAVVHRVAGTGGDATYLLRLLPGRDEPRPVRKTPSRTARPTIGRSLHPVRAVDEHLVRAAGTTACVILDGQPGTGKRTVAHAVLRRFRGADDPLLIDLSTAPRDNTAWYRQALEAGQAGRAVILIHLQDLPAQQVNLVKAIATSQNVPAGLVATVNLAESPPHIAPLVRQLATPVTLPALHTISERIPELAKQILAELPGARPVRYLSSGAAQALMRWHWPGNIAELRHTLERAVHLAPGPTIDACHLPSAIQLVGNRSLSIIESAERAAIIEALHRSSGNRSQAAVALGIGRTTLYRKLRTYRIDT